jgi:hypothetical protein
MLNFLTNLVICFPALYKVFMELVCQVLSEIFENILHMLN